MLFVTPFFDHLSVNELVPLAFNLAVMEYSAGDIILDQGETPTQLYLISSGEISLTIENTLTPTKQKQRKKPKIRKGIRDKLDQLKFNNPNMLETINELKEENENSVNLRRGSTENS